MAPRKPKLLVISGPSCAGKTPLLKALRRREPELIDHLQPLVLYNSRSPRLGERDGEDYHFRSREEIESLRDKHRFKVIEARADLQAVDFGELEQSLDEGGVVYEGNVYVADALLTIDKIEASDRLSIFVSPLSKDEIADLREGDDLDLRRLVTSLMRRRLLRRAKAQDGELSLPVLQDIEERASLAYDEMKHACRYDWVIPNHDGEDSENWDRFHCPLGDARRTVLACASVLRGETFEDAERWEPDLLP